MQDCVKEVRDLESSYEDINALIELTEEEEDREMIKEIQREIAKFEKEFEDLRIRTLLSGEYDSCNAIVTLHAGAGGTDSCDWANMLYRMYTRYAQSKGFQITVLDYQDGDITGLKGITFEVTGDNAYGYFQSEKGVHRLVRISPFNAAGKRQTSFVSCDVMPDIEKDLDVEVNDEDIRIDTYRSSGAGGQHINKTSSAIRITHLPTGIVVECQDERSQHKNKEKALKVLRSRLYDAEKAKHDAEIAGERKAQVGTGDRSERIRTYNYPQGRVSDHRIGLTLYKLEQFLNGDMDEMIDALITADTAEKLKAQSEE